MLLEEAQARLKKNTITQEQLQQINSLYILLDLDKDIFCNLVDVVGLDVFIAKQKWYERLERAEAEFSAKECYLKAKNRLIEIDEERKYLECIVNSYSTAG